MGKNKKIEKGVGLEGIKNKTKKNRNLQKRVVQ